MRVLFCSLTKIYFLSGLIPLLIMVQFANAQTTINPIPPGLHKCIDLTVGIYGIGIGLNASMGKNGNVSKATDDTVKAIEGCVKGAYLKLYPNG